MRSTVRKLLTGSLLATYVGISVLGQGLHLLAPDHGHHHHGLQVVTCTAPDHCDGGGCCHHHDDGDQDRADHAVAGQFVTASGGAHDSHNCEICEFLFQAVGQPPQIADVPDLHPLVAVAALPHHEIYSSAILGLHAARGPPQLLA